MAQTYGFRVPITREDIAWALHEWHGALYAVNTRPEAEIYACAEELVVAFLSDRQTFAALFSAFASPDRELMQLTAELCAEGEIALEAYLLLGASCALRLRQLLWEAGV